MRPYVSLIQNIETFSIQIMKTSFDGSEYTVAAAFAVAAAFEHCNDGFILLDVRTPRSFSSVHSSSIGSSVSLVMVYW